MKDNKPTNSDNFFDNYSVSKHDTLPYSKQLEDKQTYVERLFSRINYSNVLPIVKNPKPQYYRHKIILSCTNVKMGKSYQIRLGLFTEGTRNIKPGIKHVIHDSLLNEYLEKLEKIFIKSKLTAATRFENKGVLKHVWIRKSYATDEIMLVLVTKSTLLPNSKELVKEIISSCPKIKTIIQNIQPIETPVVLGKQDKILYGDGHITDKINELNFRLSYKSFYQVNPYQMFKLYDFALTSANILKTDIILDCYSGIGTITLLASLKAKEVIGIEVNKDATKDSLYNKQKNNISNAVFVNGDVEQIISELDSKVDLLILDPTRDGATVKFLDSVLELKPKKVLYISCDPNTQVRDLKLLLNDYNISLVQPFDMFSYTQHVEVVVVLERKD